MFRNYLKTALRNLRKNKQFTLINIIGLAAGTICCLYILLYVQNQYNFDSHHTDAKNIYRLNSLLDLSHDIHKKATASPPIAPAMKEEFPEVAQYTRVLVTHSLGAQKHLVKFKEKTLFESEVDYADSTFFDIFTYHFVNGNAASALREPYTVVLLKSTADKLFGNEDPLNKVITIDNTYGNANFKVTGVIDESMGRSHLSASIFISMNSNGPGAFAYGNNSWAGDNLALSYIKLKPGTDKEALEKKLPGFLERHGADQLKSLNMSKVLSLQPIQSIQITTGFQNEPGKPVSQSVLKMLLALAALIQIIACINFMNLATARAGKRAKEIGVRKVIGAGRADLIKQFLSESFLVALTGVLVAFPLLTLLLPWLNEITNSNIHLSMIADPSILGILAGIVLITGFLAGSYPAFYLSGFQPVKVIKGNFTNHISAAGIRKGLVVFQFVLSIMLIAGIIIIYSQLTFIQKKDLGFSKQQKLIFSFVTNDGKSKKNALIDGLRAMPEVTSVSTSNSYPSQFVSFDWLVYLAGGNAATAQDPKVLMTDEYYLKTTGIQLTSGRDFRLNDSGKVMINETLAARLGLSTEAAPGTLLYLLNQPPLQIVGVTKDFNYNSLHEGVVPFMFYYGVSGPNSGRINLNTVIASVQTDDYKKLLVKIQQLWTSNIASEPFSYSFLDEEIQKQYEAEITLSKIIYSFALLAIVISSLGLLGLAAFNAEQRTKEIGIRKVLGSSVSTIIGLLSKEYLKLVVLSFLLATPLAWWSMNKWLEAFAYRVDITWWMFGLAGLVALIIAIATVSVQAMKAALANPIKSLKEQ